MPKRLHASKRTLLTVMAVGLILAAGAAYATTAGLFTTVKTNTVTVTLNPTVTATPIITVASTTVTGTTFTTTGSTAYFVPAAMYYTYNDGSGFFRTVSPFTGTSNGTAFTESTDANGSSVTGTATCSAYCDLGFYYQYGALSNLSTHPVTVTGTGFAINLWLNPEGWTWNGSTWVGVGTSGAYGLGTTTGTATVGTSSSFYITSAASGSCLAGLTGNTLTVAQIEGDCPSATFALWVGVVGSASGASFSVSSVSQPYP
jgi:hypothetical protein